MRRLKAFLLAGIMMLGVGVHGSILTARAVDTPPTTLPNPNQPTITKNFEVANGIAIPSVTFRFSVRKITNDNKAPEASIADISFGPASSKVEQDGKQILTANAPIDFKGTFPHAGMYEYEITEVKDTFQVPAKGTMVYSEDRYILRVYVANNEKDNTLFVESVVAVKNPDVEGTGTKVNTIEFTNVYKKESDLRIEKNTVGSFADKTKKFPFTITMHKSPTASSTLEGVSGSINGTAVSVKYDGQPVAFELAHGEALIFPELPAGTTYEVTEVQAKDGYVPSIVVIENGVERKISNTLDDASVTTGKSLVTEGENKVVFTNTHNDTPVTGIISHNLPFVLMIGVAIVGFVVLAALKWKKSVRK